MTALLVYFAAAFGFAYVVGHSVISRPTREFIADLGQLSPPMRWLLMLLECPACLGWWIGLAMGIGLGDHYAAGFGIPSRLLFAPLLAFATAGVNFVLGRVTGLMPDVPPGE